MLVYFEDINGLHDIEPKHLKGYTIIDSAYGYPILRKEEKLETKPIRIICENKLTSGINKG
jgi:hypothetical protein